MCQLAARTTDPPGSTACLAHPLKHPITTQAQQERPQPWALEWEAAHSGSAKDRGSRNSGLPWTWEAARSSCGTPTQGHALSDQVLGGSGGTGAVAGHLPRRGRPAGLVEVQEGEGGWRVVAGLHLAHGPIDGAACSGVNGSWLK